MVAVSPQSIRRTTAKGRALFSASFGQRLFADVAEVSRMRPHALRQVPPPRLDVAAELFFVGPAGLADRGGANDRHLTILGQVGVMGLHAILECAAARLRLIATLRFDVRPASLDDRRGGER